eukprot:gene19436-21361_t
MAFFIALTGLISTSFAYYNPLSLYSKCEDLQVKICKGLDYNRTSFPNSLGHQSQKEAEMYIKTYARLIESGCYKEMKLFLCSIYFPVCTSYTDTILPCRRFCRKAMKGCAPIMKQHNYEWPRDFKCSKFPKRMCLEKPKQSKSSKSKKRN